MLEGRGIGIVAIHIAQHVHQLGEAFWIQAAVVFHAVFGALLQLIEIPAGLGYTDNRNISSPRLASVCRAGKIFLWARSPVAPKKTRASDMV